MGNSVLGVAKDVGILRLARQFYRHQGSLLILCYHGISQADEHLWRPSLYLDPESFRSRLQTIRDFGYRVLPFSQALATMRAGELREPTIAITFDDGWHDYYRVAWPILKEFGFDSTVYQTTFYSLYNRPVFDTSCSYLLWRGRGRTIGCDGLLGITGSHKLDSMRSVDILTKLFHSRAKAFDFSSEQKDELLAQIANRLDLDYGAFLRSRVLQLMNPCEVKEVSDAGVDIQLHTHRHQTPFDRALFLREIYENRELIETSTGKPAVHFCYPNGEHRPEFAKWLKEAGVQSATTTDPGMASISSESLFLPRITDSACVSRARFESWLSGVGLLVPACRKALPVRKWFTKSASQTRPAEGHCRSEWAG